MIDWIQLARQQEKAFLADLTRLLQIPSVYDPEAATPEAPFGPAVGQALDTFLALAERDGFEIHKVGKVAGRVSWGEGPAIIGALGHVDVMPAGAQWTFPPFDCTEAEGKLYGRGVLDDKGPLLAAYYGLKILKEQQAPLTNTIHLIVGTNEESNWDCMTRYFQTEPVPDAGFSPDSTFPLVHAEKGIMHLDLHFKPLHNATIQLEEFHAGENYNSVPDTASCRFKHPNLPERSLDAPITTIRYSRQSRGDTHTFAARGRSAHAMNPKNGSNAATWLAHLLAPVLVDSDAATMITFLKDYAHEDHHGITLGIAEEDAVMGPLTMNVGKVRWTRESGGTVSIDIRYPRTTNPDKVITALQSLPLAFEVDVVLADTIQSRPHYVAEDSPLVTTLLKVYETQTHLPAKPIALGGGTYAKTFPNCVAYGPLFPGREETAHCPDEYMLKDDLFRAMAIYAQALYELGRLTIEK